MSDFFGTNSFHSETVDNLVKSLHNTPDNFIGGQLTKFSRNWENITSDPEILQMVYGSVIGFTEFAVQGFVRPPLRFNREETEQMDLLVGKLAQKSVVKPVKHCRGEFISNVFLRPKKDGSFRLILDLSILNEIIEYIHFKLDSIKTAMNLIRPNCFMACLDWKDAYFSVPVHKKFKKFLRFFWGGQLFEFQCLVMGLSEAPRKFTKLTKPLWSTLRREGYTSVNYIDDAILIGDSYEQCLDNVIETVHLSDSLGFTVHPEKSVLSPSQCVTFLGFVINSVTMSVTLTEAKRQKIKKSCVRLIALRKCSIRDFAQVIGQLVATEPCFPHAPLFYRDLESAKTETLKFFKGNYDATMRIREESKIILKWWVRNVDILEGPVHLANPSVLLRSDSSGFAWGGVIMSPENLEIRDKTKGSWSEIELQEHINYKELKAAFFVLVCFCEKMQNVHIKMELDNTTAVSYVNKMGGKFPHLAKLAQEMWLWAKDRQIWISATHLPGVLNTAADAESRDLSDENKEWQLDPKVFQEINNLWGPLQIDLFATRINTQLGKFVSWSPDPESIAVNSLLMSWANNELYAFPPFSILSRVIRKVEADHAELVLIAPIWPTQPWYPRLLQLCVDYPRTLPGRMNLLRLPQKKQEVHPLLPKLKLGAFRLSGNLSRNKAFRREQQVLSWDHGKNRHGNNTGYTSRSGSASRRKGDLIPFLPLSVRC